MGVADDAAAAAAAVSSRTWALAVAACLAVACLLLRQPGNTLEQLLLPPALNAGGGARVQHAAAAAAAPAAAASSAICSRRLPACTFAHNSQQLLCNGSVPRALWSANTTNWWATWHLDAACSTRPSGCLWEDLPAPPKRIVLMGDSQGLKFTYGLFEVMRGDKGVTCRSHDYETKMGHAAFYGIPDLIATATGCTGCESYRSTCTHTASGRSLQIDYLRMESVLDQELTTPHRGRSGATCDAPWPTPCHNFWSSQLLLFKGYLRQLQPPPDQIHIMQNVHDCNKRSPREFRRDLAWLVDLLDEALLPGTSIYFWPTLAPNPEQQPKRWRNVTTQACAARMNAEVLAAIAPHVERTAADEVAAARGDTVPLRARWYPAFDMFTPTQERMDMVMDGIHYRSDYYVAHASALVAGLCTAGRGTARH